MDRKSRYRLERGMEGNRTNAILQARWRPSARSEPMAAQRQSRRTDDASDTHLGASEVSPQANRALERTRAGVVDVRLTPASFRRLLVRRSAQTLGRSHIERLQ